MANNQKLRTNSYISEDWYGGYKLEVDLTGNSRIEDWTMDFNLSSSYSIRNAYGVDLVKNGNGSYSFSGQGSGEDLSRGESTKAIFIINDNGKQAIIPKFKLQGSTISTPSEEIAAPTNPQSNELINTKALVTQDWKGGYKLEVDLTGNSKIEDWTMDFDLSSSYSIRDAYGVDLVKNGNGSYSFNGQGSGEDLSRGESTKAIFIIDDNGKKAIVPEFKLQGSTISTPVKIEDTTPTVVSSNGIKVGFENHSNNTAYNYDAQSKDWNVNFSSDDMNRYAKISSNEAYSGNKSLKITYPDNTQLNAGAGWDIPDAKEYYLSYQVKFANNFDFNGKYDWSSGGKLPGLGAGDLWSGGIDSDGTKGFTSRPMWREDGRAVLYLYHMDKPGQYGEDVLLKGSDGKENYFEPGKWHNITQRVRINDGNQSNGEVDVWMDREQVLSMDNLQFVTDGQEIDTMFFNTFHGGYGSDWWPENDVEAYFDDFVVSTNAADVGL